MSDNRRSLSIHVIRHHAPGRLNRDRSGLLKRGHIHGMTTLRISSQCYKKALRSSKEFENLSQKLNYGLSVRSAILPTLTAQFLMDNGVTAKLAHEYAIVIHKRVNGNVDDKKKRGDDTEKDDESVKASKQVGTLGRNELIAINAIALEAVQAGLTPADITAATPRSNKQAQKDFVAKLNAIQTNAGLDAYAFGRTMTGVLNTLRASISVGHSLTTHPVKSTLDEYVATDDLRAGSAYMGNAEIGGGVFYVPIVFDIAQMERNIRLDGSSSLQEPKIIATILREMLHTIAVTDISSGAANREPGNTTEIVAVLNKNNFALSASRAFKDPIYDPDLAASALRSFVRAEGARYGQTYSPHAVVSWNECKDLDVFMNTVNEEAKKAYYPNDDFSPL